MRILYYGPFRDGSGYAVAARGYLKAFDKLIQEGEDIDLHLLTLDLEGRNSKLSKSNQELIEKYEFKFDGYTGITSEKEVDEWLDNPEPFIFIWHQPAPMITWERYYDDPFWKQVKKFLSKCKWNISFTVWEADKIHPAWVDTYKVYDVDAVVVPSKYNHNVFKDGLPKDIKCFYIPHPVEKKQLGKSKKLKGLPDLGDKFVIFSMSQWGVRKGFDKLLMAYYLEFGHQQDVVLIIKTNGSIMNSQNVKEQKQHIIADAKQYKSMIFMDSYMEQPTCDVVLLTDFLPRENIQWLYEQADVFALPARAEGFGLTLAEAIVNKVPVITTRTSGQSEFLMPFHPFLIDGMYEPYLSKSEFTNDMNWFEPSVNSIRMKLRNAYNWKKSTEAMKLISDKQLKYFEEQNYTIERVSKDLKDMLNKMSKDIE